MGFEEFDEEKKEVKKGRRPDMKARIEMPCWFEKDRNGRTYLSCKLFGESVRIFKEKQPVEAEI